MKTPSLKSKIFNMVAATTAVSLLIVSCSKEEKFPNGTTDVDNIVEFTDQLYLKTDVTGGDEQTPFSAPNDGLIDEYTANETYFAARNGLVANRLIRCLVNVNLTEEQTFQTRRAVSAFHNRNHELIKKHRAAVAELNQGMQNRREHLIAQLRNGEIDRPTFYRAMANLREKYVTAINEIKQTYANDFSLSFRLLMMHFKDILDENQWQRFATCVKLQTG
jgi:hypothetical protein